MEMSIENLPDYGALYNKKLSELKKSREFLLQKLDVLFLRSLENNDSNFRNKIVSLKNSLRDFPSDMKNQSFKNFDELNKWVPDYFNIENLDQ